MDALSGVLERAKLKTVFYPKFLFSSPWGVEMEQDSRSQFWKLLKGTCYLRVPGEKDIKMNVGDIVCIPHGSKHLISGKSNSTCVPASEFGKAYHSGKPLFQGRDEETILMGGHFEFTPSVQHPFIKSLPKVIHINTTKEINLCLEHAALMMNEEISSEKIGSKLILSRLVDILFVLIIRAYIEQVDIKGGFLMALKDDRICKSLKNIHEFPEKDWKLNQLAASANMSRSLYCREFKRFVGETPLSYLTNWRILKSKELLSESKDNISEIANRVGYQSEAAFNRLFKSKVGETPASYRRKVLA